VLPSSTRPVLSLRYFGYALAIPLAGGATQMLIWSHADDGWNYDSDYVLAIGRR
jgi:hypothetical protein